MLAFGLVSLVLTRHLGASVMVSYPKAIMGQFSGRIYVFVSKDPTSEPRLGPDWAHPGPVLVVDVKQSKPDMNIALDDRDATGLTGSLSRLPPGDYTFQAVIDRNPASPRVGDGDGNLYSTPMRAHIDSSGVTVNLVCDQIVDEPTVHSSATVKVVELESIPLSNAQRRSVVWRSVVVLPSEFASQPNRKFPILLDIPDRGDTYANYPSRDSNAAAYRDGKPFIYVRLDPESSTGYHSMADSANNGPYAKALVEEYLPYLAKQYHGDLGRVVVSGAGAGGWSALWLQCTQPTAFSGCWAMNPDSVDFHAVRGLNLYADENAYRETLTSSAPRAWVRGSGETWAEHAAVERVLRGFWITGWEYDFSPKAKNGKPTPLFDRDSGKIDPAVAKAWQAFDIDAALKTNWLTLGPQFAAKLHIYSPEGDPGFRSDAVRQLLADLAQLGAHADIEMLTPGATASGNGYPGLAAQIARAEAVACYPGG